MHNLFIRGGGFTKYFSQHTVSTVGKARNGTKGKGISLIFDQCEPSPAEVSYTIYVSLEYSFQLHHLHILCSPRGERGGGPGDDEGIECLDLRNTSMFIMLFVSRLISFAHSFFIV